MDVFMEIIGGSYALQPGWNNFNIAAKIQWQRGQPNAPGTQRCVTIEYDVNPTFGAGLDDQRCEEHFRFICEENLSGRMAPKRVPANATFSLNVTSIGNVSSTGNDVVFNASSITGVDKTTVASTVKLGATTTSITDKDDEAGNVVSEKETVTKTTEQDAGE